MKNRIIFYSSIKNKELFHIQRFYYTDIELLKNLGYEVYNSNKIIDFLFFWEYDIAFIYFYRFGLLPALLSRLFNKKVYFTGGIDNLESSITTRTEYLLQIIFFKLCYLFSSKCILVSSADETNVKKIYHGKLPKKIRISFHTIDIEKFSTVEITKKENIFSTISWMESVGNVYRKGVDKSIRIFKSLTEKAEYRDAYLYIIGKEGAGSDYLRQLCFELKISDRVIFTGSINEEQKIDILKQSKYYFQLSSYEGFGIAAIEALAAKNIVIHSGRGGLNDTMKDFGIKLDINKNIEEQIDYLYEQILNFNCEKLIKGQKYMEVNYSNVTRQKDFENILKNKPNV